MDDKGKICLFVGEMCLLTTDPNLCEVKQLVFIYLDTSFLLDAPTSEVSRQIQLSLCLAIVL